MTNYNDLFAAASSGLSVIDTWTSLVDATWTKPADAKFCFIRLIGGGGGGGGGDGSVAGQAGSGALFGDFWLQAADLAATEDAIIGLGGAGGAAGANGVAGSPTIFGGFCTLDFVGGQGTGDYNVRRGLNTTSYTTNMPGGHLRDSDLSWSSYYYFPGTGGAGQNISSNHSEDGCKGVARFCAGGGGGGGNSSSNAGEGGGSTGHTFQNDYTVTANFGGGGAAGSTSAGATGSAGDIATGEGGEGGGGGTSGYAGGVGGVVGGGGGGGGTNAAGGAGGKGAIMIRTWG